MQAVGLVRWGSASSLDGAGLEGGAGSRSVRATHQEATLARRRRRWQCFVATGLIVMPFLPASNLFFWVSASSMTIVWWQELTQHWRVTTVLAIF